MEKCGNVKKYHEKSGTENDRYKEVTEVENTTAIAYSVFFASRFWGIYVEEVENESLGYVKWSHISAYLERFVFTPVTTE